MLVRCIATMKCGIPIDSNNNCHCACLLPSNDNNNNNVFFAKEKRRKKFAIGEKENKMK